MSRFRPQLAPTLFTIPVVLVCVALGVWQLQRLDWKRELIAQREAGVAAAPAMPPRSLAQFRPATSAVHSSILTTRKPLRPSPNG